MGGWASNDQSPIVYHKSLWWFRSSSIVSIFMTLDLSFQTMMVFDHVQLCTDLSWCTGITVAPSACHGGIFGWGSTGPAGPTGSSSCLPAAVLDDLHGAGPVWATAGRAHTEQWAHAHSTCADRLCARVLTSSCRGVALERSGVVLQAFQRQPRTYINNSCR